VAIHWENQQINLAYFPTLLPVQLKRLHMHHLCANFCRRCFDHALKPMVFGTSVIRSALSIQGNDSVLRRHSVDKLEQLTILISVMASAALFQSLCRALPAPI
jgi:hypothetical protein